MKKFIFRQKFFIAVILLLLVATAQVSEAKTTKAGNIASLFARVNPSLGAKRAKDYAAVVVKAGEKFKQDPYAIAAIIVHESTVNHKAVSKGGDYGLMQIRWKVHAAAIKKRFPKVKKANDLFDVRTNVLYGTEIFSDCMSKSGNNLRSGILRYSAGNTKLADKVIATINELNGGKKVKAGKKK